MDDVTTVSVVVPLYNGRHLVDACLGSIPDDVEVIAVDDASSDGVGDVVADRHPRVRLLRNDVNLGFGATANRGLAAASGRVRLVLNSDARLRPGALDALVAAFDADPGVGIAGARLVFADGSHQTSAAAFPSVGGVLAGSFLLNELHQRLRPGHAFPWPMGLTEAEHQDDRDVDWVIGAALAIRDRCFDAIGGFDAGYFLYGEETDLCWRAHQAGWRVRFVAGAVVEHDGGGSTGDPGAHARRFLVSERRFFARAHGERSLRRWRTARIVGSIAKIGLLALPALADRRARQRLRWHIAAVAHLVRDRGVTPA